MRQYDKNQRLLHVLQALGIALLLQSYFCSCWLQKGYCSFSFTAFVPIVFGFFDLRILYNLFFSSNQCPNLPEYIMYSTFMYQFIDLLWLSFSTNAFSAADNKCRSFFSTSEVKLSSRVKQMTEKNYSS
jgi:hypothetical protein